MTPRRLLLLATAVAEQEGPWTTRRVQRLYRALGYDNGPLRRMARRDLAQLAREGVLDLHDEDPGRRHYTRNEQQQEQLMARTLPHDKYIEHVADALGAAGMEIADGWTSDAETRGVYCYLNAVITLDPETSGLDEKRWPHGLIITWEWHTGLDDSGDERGPSWQWARLNADGSNWELEALTAEGYASPEYIVECIRALLEKRNAACAAAKWEHVDALNTACEEWGADEDGTA